MMPDSPTGVPLWVWKAAAYLVGGVLTLLTTVLGWLGKRYVTKRDQQIQELRRKMNGDHQHVEEKVDRLEYKVDTLIEEMQS